MGHISSILAGAKIGVQNGREILLRPIAMSDRANAVPATNSYDNWQNMSNDYWTDALYNPNPLIVTPNDWTENPYNLNLSNNEGPVNGFNDYLDRLENRVNNRYGGDESFGQWDALEQRNDERSQTVQIYENQFIDPKDNEFSIWGDEGGSGHNTYEINALGYDTEGNFTVNVGADGIDASAEFERNLYLLQAEGQAGNDYVGIKGEAQVGLHNSASGTVAFNPFTGTGDLRFQGEVSAGASATITPRISLGDYFQGELALSGNLGPSLSGEAQLTDENGRWDPALGARFRPGFDLDADVDYTLNTELIKDDATNWITDTDLYNRVDDFRTDLLLSDDYHDPYADQLIFENGGYPPFQQIETSNNGLDLDEMLMFDTLGVDTDISNFTDPGILDVGELPPVDLPDPYVESGIDPGSAGMVNLGGSWIDPSGFPDDFIESAIRFEEYNFDNYDLVSSNPDPGSIGLTYNDGYAGVSFNMEF